MPLCALDILSVAPKNIISPAAEMFDTASSVTVHQTIVRLNVIQSDDIITLYNPVHLHRVRRLKLLSSWFIYSKENENV
jgi:hypothetical protein